MTIYEPNPDVGPIGAEFEEFVDVPILDDARRAPPPSRRQDETGVPDHVYDLVVLLQKAVDDVTNATRCAGDARAAGDNELARWCESLAAAARDVVARAKSMLAVRLVEG
jgi:hypothetical protein